MLARYKQKEENRHKIVHGKRALDIALENREKVTIGGSNVVPVIVSSHPTVTSL